MGNTKSSSHNFSSGRDRTVSLSLPRSKWGNKSYNSRGSQLATMSPKLAPRGLKSGAKSMENLASAPEETRRMSATLSRQPKPAPQYNADFLQDKDVKRLFKAQDKRHAKADVEDNDDFSQEALDRRLETLKKQRGGKPASENGVPDSSTPKKSKKKTKAPAPSHIRPHSVAVVNSAPPPVTMREKRASQPASRKSKAPPPPPDPMPSNGAPIGTLTTNGVVTKKVEVNNNNNNSHHRNRTSVASSIASDHGLSLTTQNSVDTVDNSGMSIKRRSKKPPPAPPQTPIPKEIISVLEEMTGDIHVEVAPNSMTRPEEVSVKEESPPEPLPLEQKVQSETVAPVQTSQSNEASPKREDHSEETTLTKDQTEMVTPQIIKPQPTSVIIEREMVARTEAPEPAPPCPPDSVSVQELEVTRSVDASVQFNAPVEAGSQCSGETLREKTDRRRSTDSLGNILKRFIARNSESDLMKPADDCSSDSYTDVTSSTKVIKMEEVLAEPEIDGDAVFLLSQREICEENQVDSAAEPKELTNQSEVAAELLSDNDASLSESIETVVDVTEVSTCHDNSAPLSDVDSGNDEPADLSGSASSASPVTRPNVSSTNKSSGANAHSDHLAEGTKKAKHKHGGIHRITKSMRAFMSSKLGKGASKEKEEAKEDEEQQLEFSTENWTLSGNPRSRKERPVYKPTWTEKTFSPPEPQTEVPELHRAEPVIISAAGEINLSDDDFSSAKEDVIASNNGETASPKPAVEEVVQLETEKTTDLSSVETPETSTDTQMRSKPKRHSVGPAVPPKPSSKPANFKANYDSTEDKSTKMEIDSNQNEYNVIANGAITGADSQVELRSKRESSSKRASVEFMAPRAYGAAPKTFRSVARPRTSFSKD